MGSQFVFAPVDSVLEFSEVLVEVDQFPGLIFE